MPPSDRALRLAHVSDVHVTVPLTSWRREDWLSKRLAAWVNLKLLGRGYRFRHAEDVLVALAADLDERRPDRLIFSGDATAMGFEEEMARAACLLKVDERAGLAVPGNHDYCTRGAMASGAFERHFAAWQHGERVGGEAYPFAQQAAGVWLVAVNSATANRWAWDARGEVGAPQLRRLEQLFGQLGPGPRVLVTHYPVAVASGKPEPRPRQLRDLEALLDVAARNGVCLWLHGHRHDAFHHADTDLAPFPIICAGSATQSKLWSYGEYLLAGGRLTATQRVYDPDARRFRAGGDFTLELPVAQPRALAPA